MKRDRTAPRISATARSPPCCPPPPRDGCILPVLQSFRLSAPYICERPVRLPDARSAGSAPRAIPASSQAPQHNTDDLLDCTTAYRLHGHIHMRQRRENVSRERLYATVTAEDASICRAGVTAASWASFEARFQMRGARGRTQLGGKSRILATFATSKFALTFYAQKISYNYPPPPPPES